MKEKIKISLTGLINSYSILFFSQNRVFGLLILIASFTTFQIGFFGLFSTIVAILASHYFKQNTEDIKSGILSFNSTLIGFAVGAFFLPNTLAYFLIFPFSLLTYFLTIVLKEKFFRSALPYLSLPFTLVIWIFMAAHFQIFTDLSPIQKSDPRYFSLLLLGSPVSFLDGLFFKAGDFQFLWAYFKSLGFITFNSSIATGAIISIGLLIHSRVAFLLSLIGAAIAIYICSLLNISMDTVEGTSITSNFVFTFLAIGGFFLLTSYRSILWSIIAGMGVFLLYFAIRKVIVPLTLPVVFAPFCINTILFLSFFYVINRTKSIGFPSFQRYSPEKNIYGLFSEKMSYDKNAGYLFTLPFIGEWVVSQGHDGSHTHIGGWNKALDFIIVDESMKPYCNEGKFKEDYYAFSKPVIATSDGFIEEIYDGIEDNRIGEDNLQNNWGNTIIIRHSALLFSKLSHLHKDSVIVKKGDFVRRGDIIAKCGNSGRSPYPHIHFQFQSTSQLDDKGIDYNLSFFEKKCNYEFHLIRNDNPQEGESVRIPDESSELKTAFKFAPGTEKIISYTLHGNLKHESWLSLVDEYNRQYLYCKETNSFAYFTSYDANFKIYNFFGDTSSVLYYFYLAASHLLLLNLDGIIYSEKLPITVAGSGIAKIIQDFVSPFYIFLKPFSNIEFNIEENTFEIKKIKINSKIFVSISRFKKEKFIISIDIQGGIITNIEINMHKLQIKAKCEV